MRQPVLSTDKFAAWFNSVVLGAYRNIDAEDVKDMTKAGLIGCYGRYYHSDIETVRAVLQYELLRHERNQLSNAIRTCKRCHKELVSNNGVGRPREYCQVCEKYRNRDSYLDWKGRHEICS